MKKKLKITQIRSIFGRLPKHRACVAGLGLRRIRHTVELEDTPAVRGMVNKVAYLLKVEEI
ncbi:50S ribosomal protein L30 [Thioploca ingrica]|jgi:large subunit ribosomal protein L30|uniref:Large ribosomal subunit protein uL30 n=1 Tax=Thioploca ingrica TaxID=40754 RepID=A0A090BU70_9GAMM|nr:50S ribosomal protein L30 [Thioploca ingrica]